MKSIIEFNLPEDEEEARITLNASKWYTVVWRLDKRLRDYIKYGHKFKNIEDALESIRADLTEYMDEHNLTF